MCKLIMDKPVSYIPLPWSQSQDPSALFFHRISHNLGFKFDISYKLLKEQKEQGMTNFKKILSSYILSPMLFMNRPYAAPHL